MANLASPTGRGGAVLIAADGSSTKRTTPDRLNAGSGSLNSTHVLTQTVAKRRSAMTRCMTAFAACLFVFELLRHLVFQGGKFCGELPRGAPVAVLLAGSAHAFNRTHCGLANRVIAPFTRLGHRVVVFAADENGDDDAMVPALERMRKDYPNVDFVIAPSADSAEDQSQSSHGSVSTTPDQCVASVEHRFRHMNLGPGSIYAESHQTAAAARARWVESNLGESSNGPKLPGRDAVHASDEKLGAHRKRVVHYMRRLHARKRANDARLKWEKERKESNGNGNVGGGSTSSMDKFVWIVYARPDVAFADEVPAERACLPPGGRRVHVPWFHSRGGANDRFMMGPPEGASEYLNLYDSLCDARAASGEEYTGLIPRGADSEEKVLRWHLRRRHVTADPWLLFNFVFYRVRSEFPFEDRRAPDNGLSASPFNPSRGRWSDAAAELERCPAIYERSTKGRARVGKTTQEGAELATRVNSDAADGSDGKKHGGSKTGWVGKILEPGVNNSDDDDSDDDAPGMTPEDLGMTEGGGKGRAKASHHVTWLIASTSTEAQTLIPEWIMGFGLVLFGLAFTLIASGIVAEGFRHYRAHYAIRREERERKRGDGDEV